MIMVTTMQEIEKGYKQSDAGVIPLDWNAKRLGDLGECLIGLTYKPENVREYGVLVLRSSNIVDGHLAFNDNVYVDSDIPERIRAKNDDILICVRNGSRELIGKCALLNDRVERQTFGAFMSVFRTSDAKYIFYQFQSDNIQRQIHENIGATINQITNKSLKAFVVPYPIDSRERDAIAQCLSETDVLIASIEKLIAKKRAIKQGAMQELLTGKRRLPGFSENWETKKLGEIAEITKGQGLSKGKLSQSGKHHCILYGELFTTYKEEIVRVFSKTNDEEGRLSKQGDVLLPGSTTTIGVDLAKASALLIDNVLLGGDINIIRQISNTYDPTFLAYCLTHICRNEIAQLAKGITIYHLHGKDLYDLGVNMPDCAEQAAISQVLRDVDTEIVGLEQQLAKYKMLKQGMMQVLLTGRIRLV